MTQATRQHRLLVRARHLVNRTIRTLAPIWELMPTRALVALTGVTMVTSAVFGG